MIVRAHRYITFSSAALLPCIPQHTHLFQASTGLSPEARDVLTSHQILSRMRHGMHIRLLVTFVVPSSLTKGTLIPFYSCSGMFTASAHAAEVWQS